MLADNVSTDLQVAEDFLRALRRKHTLVAIHPFEKVDICGWDVDMKDKKAVERAMLWVEKMQARGCNIYFHSNPVKQPLDRKARKGDVLDCTHAQADIDPFGEGTHAERRANAEEVLAAVSEKDPPTFVIDSGNGFNVLWELEEPVDTSHYDTANKFFNFVMGAKGTFNCDRILKLPGTIAWSGQAKLDKGYPVAAQARLVSHEKGNRLEHFPATEVPSDGVTEVDFRTHVSDFHGEEFDRDRVEELMLHHASFLKAMGGGSVDRSAALVSIAWRLKTEGFSPQQFTAVVLDMSQDAADHVAAQKDEQRALQRAWERCNATPPITDFRFVTPDDDDAVIEGLDPVEDLMADMTGVLGALRDYAHSVAVRDSVVLEGAAALGAFGALTGGRWAVDIEGVIAPPALLGLILAPSGAGKEIVSRIFSDVDDAAPWLAFRSTYPSEVAVHAELEECPAQLVMEDEYGRVLNAAANARDHKFSVQTAIMSFYTRFTGSVRPHKTRDKRQQLGVVHNPLISGMGMTAPDPFYAAMDSDFVQGGTMGRRLMLKIDHLPPRIRRRGQVAVMGFPEELDEAIKRMGAAITGFKPEWFEDLDTWAQITAQWKGKWRIKASEEVEDYLDECYRKLDRLAGEPSKVAPLYARSAELVSRLSGMAALSDAVWDGDPYRPMILRRHAQWAFELVKATISSLVDDVEEHASAGDADAIRQRIKVVLADCLARKIDTIEHEGLLYVRKGAVRHKSKNNRKYRTSEVTSELADMIADEVIDSVKIKTINDAGAQVAVEYIRM